MYCDPGKESKKLFKRFVTLSVTTLRPQDFHSNCQVQFFQYVLGVLHFTELRGSLPKSVPLDFGLEETFAL